MLQSLSRIWLHIVFSSKERRASLQNDTVRDEMFKMLGYHVNECGCMIVRVGGWHDHVHLVCGLSRTITVANLVENVKRETSKWVKGRAADLSLFHWQAGYGVFSVSQSLLDQVVRYVESQSDHHRKMTYQEELRALCARHHIEIDERYVWD